MTHQFLVTTERLTLREVEIGDQQKIFEGFSNPIVTKYMDITYPTFEATAEQMLWYEIKRKNGTGNSWAVINEQQEFIGVISTYNLHTLHRRCEIGYWFFPEYWGKGYGKESMDILLKTIAKQQNIHRFMAEVEPENKASVALLNSLGFKREAVFKEHEFRNNQFADLEIWAKLYN
jgi:ribosomal-protein-alanine N-acetyltransferase